MNVSDYIMDSKSIMFLVLNQRNLKRIFDLFVNTLRLNYYFKICRCTRVEEQKT